MKILLICNKPPYPARDGGALAIHSMIEGLLGQGHRLKVLAINSPKFNVNPDDIPAEYRDKTALELFPADLRVKPLPAILHLLTGRSYHVSRFYIPALARRIGELLAEGFDLVQFETCMPGVYLDTVRKHARSTVILRAHNVEHLIWERLAENQAFFLKRFVLRQMARSLRKFEEKLFDNVDGIAAITERDAAMITLKTCQTPVVCIPFGISKQHYKTGTPMPCSRKVFHIGSMDWMPNQEGIRWLLEQVWPGVMQAKPDARLVLAGKNMPAWISTIQYPGVEVAGEVDNAWSFMQQHALMVVPLFSGSGVRIKIIEAMLAGKAVISTTIGAEGIHYTPGKNIFIADDALAFTASILQALDQPGETEKVGLAARELILKEHDLNVISNSLSIFYTQVSDKQ